MKTALELLGDDLCMEGHATPFCRHDLDMVARRAREEMRQAAYWAAIDAGANGLYDQSAKDATMRICAAIRKLQAEEP